MRFDLLAATSSDPVQVVLPAEEPTEPTGPKRKIQMALVVLVGLGLGIGLVCLMESLDHRIKVPEHLVAGVTLPLFGVVPRMRRLAALHRGGHLWTPGLPKSVEADAFRNLRASLLCATGKSGEPIVTLLVTSPKPAEGKSTTALNLAATCARCGERTLLIDADLRRPSLTPVFEPQHELGLVDVLKGDMPWQRALVRTEIADAGLPAGGRPDGRAVRDPGDAGTGSVGEGGFRALSPGDHRRAGGAGDGGLPDAGTGWRMPRFWW